MSDTTRGPDEPRDGAHQEARDEPREDARRATIRTTHERPAVVAGALRPDETEEMTTRVDGGQVVTTIVRPTTGGLRSTVDDHVVNCGVAERTVQHAERHTPTNP